MKKLNFSKKEAYNKGLRGCMLLKFEHAKSVQGGAVLQRGPGDGEEQPLPPGGIVG